MMDYSALELVSCLILFVVSFVAFKYTFGGHQRKLLPPGPLRRILLGNLLDIPRKAPWKAFNKWREQYGDLVYVEALGRGILVLNSQDAVEDLLVNRAKNFSDRPTFVMVGELIGLEKSLPLLPCGPIYREERKLCHAALSIDAVKKYHSLQEDAVCMYLNSILQNPEEFINQLRLTAARVIMSVIYGISLKTPQDDYITEAEETMDMVSKSTVPGAHLVDIVPALKYVPSWIPFNNIPRVASAGRALLHSMVTRPYKHAIREMQPSFVRDCIFKMQESGDPSTLTKDQEDMLLWTAGSMYGAGGETTYTSILSFIIAMARYPSVQKKIQGEIDTVVGQNRLPTIEDRPELPYVAATIKEILRWRPALPCSIARRTREAEEYGGYWIPEGTIVMPNVSAFSIDTTSGIPTTVFAPERFIIETNPPLADPETYAFGFGRRVCPGRHLGSNNLFLLVTGLMATFSVQEDRDLDPPYTDGLVSYPHPFKAKFLVRSDERMALVKDRANTVA